MAASRSRIVWGWRLVWIAHRRPIGATALGLFFLAGCLSPTESSILPAGAVSFAPLPQYQLWWSMVESCSGRSRDINSVDWYMVPGAERLDAHGAGMWIRATNQLVLAGEQVGSGGLVRHEMLHALLPVGGHPREQFLGSCDGIVACAEACEAEAGGHFVPPESAPEILPQELHTRAEVLPAELSESANGGAMVTVTTITNPYPYPVWVKLTQLPPPISSYATFGRILDLGDPEQPRSGSLIAIQVGRFGMAANQTRRRVWDDDVIAGPMGIRAFFNADTAPRVARDAKK